MSESPPSERLAVGLITFAVPTAASTPRWTACVGPDSGRRTRRAGYRQAPHLRDPGHGTGSHGIRVGDGVVRMRSSRPPRPPRGWRPFGSSASRPGIVCPLGRRPPGRIGGGVRRSRSLGRQGRQLGDRFPVSHGHRTPRIRSKLSLPSGDREIPSGHHKYTCRSITLTWSTRRSPGSVRVSDAFGAGPRSAKKPTRWHDGSPRRCSNGSAVIAASSSRGPP